MIKMFKVGDYVKIIKDQSDSSWYHNKFMKIIEIKNVCSVRVNYYWNNSFKNEIAVNNLYQDEECINKYRENKLKKILL